MNAEHMEGKGDFSPVIDQQPTAPDAALDSSDKTNKSPLPAHGRPLSRVQKLGLGIAALATAATAASCELFPFLTSKTNPNSSPSPIVEPSNSPIPTAINSENPTIVIPTATPIETASPTTTVNPEITAKPDTALDTNIKKWQNGEKIPNSMLWYGDGTPHLNLEPLNITEPSVATENIATEWIPSIQGEVLGTDEVTNLKGGTNLRLWLGETDGKHQNYVVDVNLSEYGTDYKAAIFINTSKYDALSDYGDPKFVNVKDQEAVFNKLIGNTIIYEVSASPVDSSGVTNPNVNKNEFLASNKISIDYAKFCVAAVKGDYNDALKQYPDVASMILKKGQSRSGQLDAANQPYGGAFKIPINI